MIDYLPNQIWCLKVSLFLVVVCVSGCGSVEMAQHLFLSCTTFAALWSLVRNWIGFSGVDYNIISDHFIQFIHATGGGKARCSFLQLIWLLSAWVVWNERNNTCLIIMLPLFPSCWVRS